MGIIRYVLAFYNPRITTKSVQLYSQELEDDEEVRLVTALSHGDHVVDQPSVRSSALMYEASGGNVTNS